ncbi:hypothetical protein E1189_18460 [Sansalvadorimonas verongulae]|nr:hypothetical protein [Sansalvadorimonas verongulae]
MLALNNSRFNCMSKECGWSGGYHELDEHTLSCSKKPVDCDYGCGTSVPEPKLEAHKQQCRKRPYREGNLAADYETVMEAKQLETECLEAAGHQSTPQSKQELADRLIRLYPLVLKAALKGASEANQAMSIATTTSSVPCSYQCGFMANTPKELHSHYTECAYRPFPCRHCTSVVPRRDLLDHEEKCEQRPISCFYCTSYIFQGSTAQHFLDCIGYPVNCVLCNHYLARSKLLEHQATACPQRPVNCDRCFEATTAVELDTHKQGCLFMQKIILPVSSANAAVTLVPQPNATGPVYQPEGCQGDSSVIYLALSHEKFQRFMHCQKEDIYDDILSNPLFISKDYIKCRYAESPSTISPLFRSYYEAWGLKVVQPIDTRKHRFVWTNMDILDTQNQKIAHLMQVQPAPDSEGGVKICVNAPHANNAEAILKKKDEQEAKVLSHKFPSDLMLIRLQHDKKKPA